MFDKYFLLIYDFVKNKKRQVLVMAVLLALSVCPGFYFSDFSGSVALMLPDDINITRNIAFFRDSKLSSKIIVSLELNAEDKNKQDLFSAADKLMDSLEPPLFTKTVTGYSGMEIMEDMVFSNYIPRVITEEELLFIDSRLTPEYISKRLREIYRQLLKPQGLFMSSMIYSDPLGIRSLLFDRLSSLSDSMEFDVNIEDGHFISSDGRHTMVISQTPVRVTDGSGAKELLAELNEKIDHLPDFVTADIISGHSHTLSNEKVIKKDIQKAVIFATVGFLLLFLIAFRDIRAVYIFLVPSAAVVISISLASMFIGNISLWVIGLSTIVAGIAVDYGIHVYVAVRSSGRDAGVINHIVKPICMGAFTTLGIFAAFFFSNTKGYHHLAFISILSIFLSLVSAIFILPHLFSTGSVQSNYKPHPEAAGKRSIILHKLIAALWFFSICAAVSLSLGISFESNIQKLDGSEPAVIQAEENFLSVWGRDGDKAFFVVSGSDYEEALEINDRVYTEAVQAVGAENFMSLTALWPSGKTRLEKIERWNDFWKAGREEKLRRLIIEHGSDYGFSGSAFSQFFNDLYSSVSIDNRSVGDDTPKIFKERFVLEKKDGFQILSFFPDKQQYIDRLSEVSRNYPGAFIASRKVLSEHMSSSIYSEAKKLTIIAASFIILITFIFLKNVRRSMLALVPVATSVFWLLGYMSMAGIALNVATLFAGIVVMGLCIDYGIFMTYNYQHNLRKNTIISISISAVTTLIGSGVLLFAKHPALFSSGITLFIGMLAGYVSAVFIIPSLEKIFPDPKCGGQCE